MFYYYGGKIRLADKYPTPTYPTVVEPFAGGAAYAIRSLRSGAAQRAVLFDTDERVVEMWRRAIELGPEGVLAMPDVVAGTVTSDPLHITSAASNCWGSVYNLTVTPRMVRWWPQMKRNMADALREVGDRIQVHHADYAQADVGPATYFVDPPYQTVRLDGSTPAGSRRGKGYRKGSNSDSLDFAALGEWCRGLRGQVIATEQAGADWLPFEPLALHSNSQGVQQTEVVWYNDEARATLDPTLDFDEEPCTC